MQQLINIKHGQVLPLSELQAKINEMAKDLFRRLEEFLQARLKPVLEIVDQERTEALKKIWPHALEFKHPEIGGDSGRLMLADSIEFNRGVH
jgi:hypothetical protein